MTWVEACQDKRLQNLPYKIEISRQGKLILSPTRNKHGFYQGEITYLLRKLLPHGHVLVECAVDSPEGTSVADVACASASRFEVIKEEYSCSVAPEICVEVWLPSNSPEEIAMKRRLYLEKGALEFWFCDDSGTLKFYSKDGSLERSVLCPGFPEKVPA
jgi:Uma2 family endonuclease